METMWILKVAGFIALGTAGFLLVTYVLMRLWNGLVPQLFNGPRLRFVQALGLLFLTRLLVGGFGSSRGYGHLGFGHGAYGWRGGYEGKWHQYHHRQAVPFQPRGTDTTAIYRP